jgi:GNAT superfamily N-acetyltransferase
MEYLSLEDAESMRSEILDLYGSVNWQRYTEDPDQLIRALDSSDVVIAMEGDTLVGLARAISDGETIVYIQDLLVRPSAQRQGVATQLMTWLLEPYSAVKQKILLTDDKEDQRLFYESLGFSIVSGELRAFYRFD